jgi:hypothetical protein
MKSVIGKRRSKGLLRNFSKFETYWNAFLHHHLLLIYIHGYKCLSYLHLADLVETLLYLYMYIGKAKQIHTMCVSFDTRRDDDEEEEEAGERSEKKRINIALHADIPSH